MNNSHKFSLQYQAIVFAHIQYTPLYNVQYSPLTIRKSWRGLSLGGQRSCCQFWKMLLGSTIARLGLGYSSMWPGPLTNMSSTESLNLCWPSKLKDRPVTAEERRQARLEKGLHVWEHWGCRDAYFKVNPWAGLKFEYLVKVLDLESVLIGKGVSGLPTSVT